MPDTLLAEGLALMLTGMGTVFVFLTVLVGAMSLTSRLIGREAAPLAAEPDTEIVAVIAAAIDRHRRNDS